jgi:hypothetical protein
MRPVTPAAPQFHAIPPVKVFYFGAWDGPGHYLWKPTGRTTWAKAGPWAPGDLDASSYRRDYRGVAIPTGRGVVPVDAAEVQGVWQLTRGTDAAGGAWTALGCYDRTADSRRGSISVFVAEGDHDEQAMKALAERHFPAVWARIHGRPS